MFCPQCGAQADPGIKYCKQCGLQLNRIRGVMSRGGASTNWNDVWMEELDEHRKKRKKTPEEKRYEEIKGGVITTCIGVGVTIFLYFLMHAIASNEPEKDAAILRSVWLAGLIPTAVGLGILFNGVYVSRKLVELKRRQESLTPPPQPLFSAVETGRVAQLPDPQAQAVSDYSVTEHTTAKLRDATAANVRRETN